MLIVNTIPLKQFRSQIISLITLKNITSRPTSSRPRHLSAAFDTVLISCLVFLIWDSWLCLKLFKSYRSICNSFETKFLLIGLKQQLYINYSTSSTLLTILVLYSTNTVTLHFLFSFKWLLLFIILESAKLSVTFYLTNPKRT